MGVFAAVLMAAFLVRAEATPDQLFHRANEAYDRGDFAQALAGYQELLNQGHVSAEVLFNTANAHFRSGAIGPAVLHYRRAWMLAPRDADVLANLQLAQQRTGAYLPPVTMLDRAGQEFSRREWRLALSASYWILIALGAVAVVTPAYRRFLKPVLLGAGAVLLVTGAGWWWWRSWEQRGEAVVLTGNQTALYEPREGATPFFSVPEGSIVHFEDTFDAWVKVRAGQQAGWLPKSGVDRVYSWILPPNP